LAPAAAAAAGEAAAAESGEQQQPQEQQQQKPQEQQQPQEQQEPLIGFSCSSHYWRMFLPGLPVCDTPLVFFGFDVMQPLCKPIKPCVANPAQQGH